MRRVEPCSTTSRARIFPAFHPPFSLHLFFARLCKTTSWTSESTECFIDYEAFSPSYDLAPSPPPLPLVSSTGDTQEDRGGRGEEPNHPTAKKPDPSTNHSINILCHTFPFVLFKNISLRSFQSNFRWPVFGWFHCTMYSTLKFSSQFKIDYFHARLLIVIFCITPAKLKLRSFSIHVNRKHRKRDLRYIDICN